MRVSGTLLTVISGAILLGGSLQARADEWNKKTYLHVESPFILPGAQLVDRTDRLETSQDYMLKLMDSQSDRTIVEVYDANDDRYLGVVLAINAYRLEPTDDDVFLFVVNRDGASVLKKWFFAGDTAGVEFVGGWIDNGLGQKPEPEPQPEPKPDPKPLH